MLAYTLGISIVTIMRGLIRAAVLMALIPLVGALVMPVSMTNAVGVPTGTILIGQIKITSSNGQFISLYNNTAADIDMSTVQLAYYNYYDLTSSKLTSSRYIPLSGKLAPYSYYMVSDGAMTICYKMTVNAMSLGFSSTAGTVQVTQNGPLNILDTVSWSKTAVTTPTSVQTLPSSTSGFLQRAWVSGLSKGPGDPWTTVVPSGLDSCDLQAQLAASNTPIAPVANTTPQTVIPAVAPDLTSALTIPNLGLVAPEITELFPNPTAPQSDDLDEFIEFYNPNSSVFKLAGYRVEAGTSYSRGYTFTAINSDLQPKSYTAFKITYTNLQLANSEGRTRLLDPTGSTISETPSYEDAPEGESWSLINDSWQWTDKPTPSSFNVSNTVLPVDKTATVATTATKSPITATAKTAKSTTTKKATGKVAGASTTIPSSNAIEINDAAPLHPLVLVGIGMAAVGYALYEYRKDMANNLFKLKRHFRRRREARAQV